jgi:hypothetical protein
MVDGEVVAVSAKENSVDALELGVDIAWRFPRWSEKEHMSDMTGIYIL